MYSQIVGLTLAGNMVCLAVAQQPFYCWTCSCNSMYCGGTCSSYPAKGALNCFNGEFLEKPNCDRWCSSGKSIANMSIIPGADKHQTDATDVQTFAENLPAKISDPQVSVSHLCSFECDNGVSLFQCLIGGCPDTYGGCKGAESYHVSADGCQTVATYFYQNGGQKVDDRKMAHESVAGNALHLVAMKILKARQTNVALGVELEDVTDDDIALGVKGLEDKGLETGEKALCQWAVAYAPASGIFCGFVVKFPVVQQVNDKILNMPIVGQVTHQIATLAAGAPEPIKDAVKSAVNTVVQAVNTHAKDIVNWVKSAASSIVHNVLNFFGWMENSLYAAITGQRGRVPLPKVPAQVVV